MKKLLAKFSFSLMIILTLLVNISSSQPSLALKCYNFKSGDTSTLGSFMGGKLWIIKEQNQLAHYYEDEIRIFSLKEDKLNNLSLLKIEEDGLKNLNSKEHKVNKTEKAKYKVSHFWNVSLRSDDITAFAIDNDNTLITADKKGDLFFYDITDKEYLGRISLTKGDVAYINPLSNGSLVIIYRNGDIAYVEKMKLPFFSIFQSLRDLYSLKGKTNIEATNLKFLGEAQSYIFLLVGHKDIYIVRLPDFNVIKKIKEEKYIDFADILGDKIFYSVMNEGKIEGTFSFHRHLNVMMKFYEKKKDICVSNKGYRFSYVGSLSNVRFYDIASEMFLGEIGLNVKDLDCIKISPQENYAVLLLDQKRISIFKVE